MIIFDYVLHNSLLEHDIFISYRQEDNRSSGYDGWVTEFKNSLQNEIEATIKENISIYFDENSHDGLHEHHERIIR